VLGSKPQYTTDNPEAGESFALGESKPVHSGFLTNQLPKADSIWEEYYVNVLRGTVEGNTLIFAATNSTGDAPPEISKEAVGSSPHRGNAGLPWGGMQPTIASPGIGNGVNATAIPTLAVAKPVNTGKGVNGSVMNPLEGSLKQRDQSNSGNGRSPAYKMEGTNSSLAAWSN